MYEITRMLQNIDLSQKILICLRHAEKTNLDPMADPTTVAITKSGQESAHQLGTTLKEHFGTIYSIHSSPLRRCRETASALQSGGDFHHQVQNSTLLGDPGVYVKDPDLAGQHFANKSVYEVVSAQFKKQELVGMQDIDEASVKFAEQIRSHLIDATQPVVYVSHDAIIAAFILFASKDPNAFATQLIEYLQGFCITMNDENNLMLHIESQRYTLGV